MYQPILAVTIATGHDDLMSIRSSWPIILLSHYAWKCYNMPGIVFRRGQQTIKYDRKRKVSLCAWICWAGWFIFRGRNLPLFPDVDNVTIALWQHDSWWFWVAATWQHADFVASSNCGWRCSKGQEFTFISSRRLSRPEVAPTFSVLETPHLTYHQTDV